MLPFFKLTKAKIEKFQEKCCMKYEFLCCED